MKDVAFQCTTCGNSVRKDLLDNKHTVLGAIKKLNREETCCRRPDYIDQKGYRRAMKEQGLGAIGL